MSAFAAQLPLKKQITFDSNSLPEERILRSSSHNYTAYGWTFGAITDWNERKQAYRLRAQVYDYELQWSSSNDGYEVDMLDEFATHLAVKDPSDRIVATARILDWQVPWMATECYSSHFAEDAHHLKQASVHEVSRLCIAQNHRHTEIAPQTTVLDIILKGILAYSLDSGVRQSYFITRASMRRVMQKRNFEIPYMSPLHRTPDGCFIRSFLVSNEESFTGFNYGLDNIPY